MFKSVSVSLCMSSIGRSLKFRQGKKNKSANVRNFFTELKLITGDWENNASYKF